MGESQGELEPRLGEKQKDQSKGMQRKSELHSKGRRISSPRGRASKKNFPKK